MKILVCTLVVALLSDHALSQQVNEDISFTLSQSCSALKTLCKPYDNTPASSTSCARCESLPGKRGPKGDVGGTGQKGSRGDVGETGPAGIVNQTLLDAQQTRITELDTKVEQLEADKDELNAKVEKLEADNGELDTKVEQLEADKDELNTKVEKLEADNGVLKNKVEDLEGIVAAINTKVSNPCPSDDMIGNNGVCYFLLLDQTRTAPDGERACNDLDSRLADVGSKMTYEQLVIHVQQRLEERGVTGGRFFTLGMTFAPDSGTAFFGNGTEAAFTPWATGYDRSLPFTTSKYAGYSSYTQLHLRIQVGESVTSKRNGFLNYPPSSASYPLCQRDVN